MTATNQPKESLMSVIWRCHVTSFRGISMGAVHYYVSLHRGMDSWKVERIMTAEDAEAMREADELWGRPVSYIRAGAQTNRFDTEADAIAAGEAVWRSIRGDGDGLCRGDGRESWDVPPRDLSPLAGPDEFVAGARGFHEAAAAVGWWDGRHGAAMNEVQRAWGERLSALGFADAEDFDVERTETTVPVRLTADGWAAEPDYDEWADYDRHVAESAPMVEP